MLFSPLFVPDRLADAVSDRAWFGAMLEVEAALAAAEARAGVVPPAAADEIKAACVVDRFDLEALSVAARRVGNPVEPLVRALRRLVPGGTAGFVHHGATSQDILDTASMLVVRQALALIEGDLAGLADGLARLAEEHRDALMVGRTLLQQAVPITFGLKAAGWLIGVMRARSRLRRLHEEALAVELGGAAGTLASLGNAGIAVLGELAAELGLAEPAMPWHTERSRVVEVATALGLAAGALDKIALDIVLLSQTEVGELVERDAGGSSTMPHKRNPVGSVMVRACARQAQGSVDVLVRTMAQEHERAAGGWQAEWQALSGALAFTGGAAAWLWEVVEGLDVRPDRMRDNLDATDGLVMAEAVAQLLAEHIGREEAHDLLRGITGRLGEGAGFQAALLADDTARAHLSPQEIGRALDPATYLGSTRAFIDRALACYRDFPSGQSGPDRVRGSIAQYLPGDDND